MTAVTDPGQSLVVEARGPCAAEAELLRLVRELAPTSGAQLGVPLRIIVPSGSLRRHVVARIASDAGRSRAGVVVQTLATAADEVVGRVGEPAAAAAELVSILVRRLAAAEPGLGSELGGLDDGYGIVEEAVRDLLDAGFGPTHAPVVADKLRDLEGAVSVDRLLRVAGVIRVAAGLSARLEEWGVRRTEQLPQYAAELVRDCGPAALPSRAVIIHGFADATGVASDFFRSLMSSFCVFAIVDHPPDPSDITVNDTGVVFLDRFETMLGGLARRSSAAETVAPAVELFHAPNGESEVRQVAHRVRRLLDQGVSAEGIGVLAREMEHEATAVRTHFRRLGIPFSGTAGGVLTGGGPWRRARRLSEILRRGPDLPAEVWLEGLDVTGVSSDLGLALRTLGVRSVHDAAELAGSLGGRRTIRLPIPDVTEGEARRGRTIDVSDLEGLVGRAVELVKVFDRWPDAAPAAGHDARLRRLLDQLGWTGDTALDAPVSSAMDRLAEQLPRRLELGRREYLDAARRQLAEVGLVAVGGAGGGVQVLSAMEARGRTFDHLFMIGLNRGRFPRVVREDALLPDSVRGHIAAEVLPEFPVKARGLDEERYLFAQLVASSNRVTLSWRDTQDGSRTAPSPFVERLRRKLEIEAPSCPFPLAEVADLEPRPAFEHAILAGRGRSRDGLVSVFAETMLEGADRAGVQVADPLEWSAARVDVLEAIDPEQPADGPGPWAGLVGSVMPPDGSTPSVTGLEDVARCPWRAFVERRLGIAEMPDPRLGLPQTKGLLLGSVVHDVLQGVVEETAGRTRASVPQLADAAGHEVPWPASRRLREMAAAAAREVAFRNGLAGTGVAPLLAAQVMPLLEVARAMDWPQGAAPGVVAAEAEGEVAVSGGIVVRFRADRVDRSADGMSLVDYKSGKPVSDAKRDETRRRHLLHGVARGRSLQAVAYALGVAPGVAGEGGYLALTPDIGDLPAAVRRATVSSDDSEMVSAFHLAVETIVRGWRSGGLTPRVEEADRPDKDPPACSWCPLASACLRTDSGYRQRVVRWMNADAEAPSEAESAARDLWWLGVERADGEAQ